MKNKSSNAPNNTPSNFSQTPPTKSSCIATFSSHPRAKKAMQHLLKTGVDKAHISLLGLDTQQGKIGRDGLDDLEDEFKSVGIPKAQFHCYQCMIHGGSYLLVVTGDHTAIEHACGLLEKMERVDDVSIHFNA